ncbi:MAG: OstA-like protein [Gemmatimonadota bacterium]
MIPRSPGGRVPVALAVTGLALLATAGRLPGQQAEDPVVIDHADELRRVFEGDSLTYFLTGNVRAHRGNVRMRSQIATIYRRSSIADFQRNVHFWDRTTEIYADRVVYEEIPDVALATGDVQLIDRETKSEVASDSLRYFREDGRIVAWPRPHAVLVPRDTAAGEPFDLYADVMRFRSDSVRSEVVAVDSVLIERTDLTAVADSLLYDDQTGIVRLRLSPRVETEETFLVADEIDVLMQDNEINALVAVGRGRAVNKRDTIPGSVQTAFRNVSPTSFLEGDSIYIAFDDEGIDWLVAEGNARSLNYTRELVAGPMETWSVNYLQGARLRLSFRGDSLSRVVATGGHRGVFRSEEVRIGGPERRPSVPIPLPEPAGLATPGTARRSGERPRRSRGIPG